MNLKTQQFLRPQKNKKQELFFEEMKEITPTFQLITNGLVLPSSRNAVWKPEHSSGGVYTENGEFVLVSGFPGNNVEKQSIIEAEDNAIDRII